MAIYIIVIYFLFFVSSILEVGGLKKSQERWLLGGLTIILILFVGLRYHTGADWYIYNRIFDQSLSLIDNPYRIEYGFLLLNKLFKLIFNNYYVLQFAVTLFVGFSFCIFYKNHSQYPIVSLSLFVWMLFYNILMAQVRQSIALAIIVFSTQYVFDRKLFHFLSVIFAACFFHISAVVAIPLYFLYRNYGKTLPLILMLIAQLFYFSPEFIKSIILFVVPYLPSRFSFFAGYLTSVLGDSQNFGSGLIYLGQMSLSIFTVLFIKPTDKKEAFFLNTLAVFVIIKGFALGIEIIERIEAYYLVFAIIAYTYLFKIRIKRLRSVYLITTCFLLLFFIMLRIRTLTDTGITTLTSRPGNYALVPYYNALSHPPEATARKDWIEN